MKKHLSFQYSPSNTRFRSIELHALLTASALPSIFTDAWNNEFSSEANQQNLLNSIVL